MAKVRILKMLEAISDALVVTVIWLPAILEVVVYVIVALLAVAVGVAIYQFWHHEDDFLE